MPLERKRPQQHEDGAGSRLDPTPTADRITIEVLTQNVSRQMDAHDRLRSFVGIGIPTALEINRVRFINTERLIKQFFESLHARRREHGSVVLTRNLNELAVALRDPESIPVVLFASSLDSEARALINRQIKVNETPRRIYLVLSERAYNARESLWGNPLRANVSFVFVPPPANRGDTAHDFRPSPQRTRG